MLLTITLTENEVMALIEKSIDAHGLTGLKFNQTKVNSMTKLKDTYVLQITNIPPRPEPPAAPPNRLVRDDFSGRSDL